MQKILVIEDDALLRATVRKSLQMRSYEVLEAENGSHGIQMAKAHLPDLIISDVIMEPGDGYEALEGLRSEPATAAIPFIFITNHANPEGMRRGMEQGADDYLPKPFTISSLLAAVDARLRKQDVMKRQAEKKLADLRASLSLMLPHELNTPIVGILGCGEIIVSDAPMLKAQELTEMGENIIASALRLRRVIQNFLLYARIELLTADPQVLSPLLQQEELEIAGYLRDLGASVAKSADRSDDLVLDLVEGNLQVSREILSKIFFELLDNAFKFSQAGSIVRAQTTLTRDALYLKISDKGRGFTQQQILEIGAFVQFDRKIYEQQGSGLGLIIAKRLSEVNLGGLVIDSEPGVGTTVTVRFPVSG
jgi:two-component system sensor histidine kinase/response regulator